MADIAMPAGTPAQQLNERFTAIYATHQKRLTYVVRNLVRGNDHHLAEDLTAVAMYQAWLSVHKCEATTDAQVFAWLASIARHTVIHHYRRACNTREVPADTGHWAYANRALAAAADGTLRPVNAHPGDSDPDADELLRRARESKPRALAGAR